MKKITPLNRTLLAVASLLLLLTYVLPIWNIDLVAPQYPEGLSMQIWLNKITGQVEIINGLNHYIGMKHIKAEMFPEFTYLVYIVAAFIALGLLVAAIGRVQLLLAYVLLLLAGGVAAMYDFYKWGYDYGHNLDPTAAIQVPGMAYQPPLIGHKQLLNSDAYSYPASGGWAIVAAGILFITVLVMEWMRNKKKAQQARQTAVGKAQGSLVALMGLMVILAGCSSGPQAFNIGKDGCHFCKMTIMTAQFGGEVITKKGKVYKFDDLHCVKGFLKGSEVPEAEVGQVLTVDYANGGKFVPVQEATFVKGGTLHSPMYSNAAGFATKEDAAAANQKLGGALTDWNSL